MEDYYGSVEEFVGKAAKDHETSTAERRELGLASRRSARFSSQPEASDLPWASKDRKWLVIVNRFTRIGCEKQKPNHSVGG
jgi:hypothetical protein